MDTKNRTVQNRKMKLLKKGPDADLTRANEPVWSLVAVHHRQCTASQSASSRHVILQHPDKSHEESLIE